MSSCHCCQKPAAARAPDVALRVCLPMGHSKRVNTRGGQHTFSHSHARLQKSGPAEVRADNLSAHDHELACWSLQPSSLQVWVCVSLLRHLCTERLVLASLHSSPISQAGVLGLSQDVVTLSI